MTLFLDEDELFVCGDVRAVDTVLAELLQPTEVEAHRQERLELPMPRRREQARRPSRPPPRSTCA